MGTFLNVYIEDALELSGPSDKDAQVPQISRMCESGQEMCCLGVTAGSSCSVPSPDSLSTVDNSFGREANRMRKGTRKEITLGNWSCVALIHAIHVVNCRIGWRGITLSAKWGRSRFSYTDLTFFLIIHNAR